MFIQQIFVEGLEKRTEIRNPEVFFAEILQWLLKVVSVFVSKLFGIFTVQ